MMTLTKRHQTMLVIGRGRRAIAVHYGAVLPGFRPVSPAPASKPCVAPPLARQTILREVQFLLRDGPLRFPVELR